jgi:hypothetical protein
LAEVFIMFLEADATRHVRHTSQAQGAVNHHAHAARKRITEFHLQKIVECDRDIVQIGKNVSHGYLKGIRHHPSVAIG